MSDILLAVSGGIDSMYLLHRASELFPEASFAVAHCNFGLRGEESDGDEAFVRSCCNELGIRCFCKSFDTAGYASANGISIEMAARELRYAWFAELAREEGFDGVAVAHNLNDNAETLMLNLLRGTGTRGAKGMAAESVFPGGEIRLLRPMLGISRDEIKAWMTARGLEWREDRTNALNEYKRNKIRNEVFPVFREINPSFLQTLDEDMKHIAQVDEIAEDYFRGCGLDPEHIDIAALMKLKHWKYLLFRLTEGRMNSDELDSLCECLESGRQIAGKRFAQMVGGNGCLLPCQAGEPEWEWEVVPRSSVSSLKCPAGVLMLDASRLPVPPEPRHWQEGDWMIPFGMKGRKKVSDIFTDLKFSVPEKKAALVIPYPGVPGRVAAVIGIRSDDSLRITSDTDKILIIRTK